MSASAGDILSTIPDTQSKADTRHIPIDKVGIKGIKHPVRVLDRSGGEQHTVAEFNMYVNLPHNFKGTHMSRFVEILNEYEREISVKSFNDMLEKMAERLEADSGHIEMTFPYFVKKAAPVTGVESLLDYQVCFQGEIQNNKARTDKLLAAMQDPQNYNTEFSVPTTAKNRPSFELFLVYNLSEKACFLLQ